ncbi:hypothetical protein Y1Q_0023037 [Alligator mississippiensis]|uniref:Uncharacterized protein n=1 Tax=Alligator mississippiensis TaxID=8496 RepID=A0A151P7D0_ALLMI|nr:hypothetical protein Y1Q_0023037 [Alligator mississippiensis]
MKEMEKGNDSSSTPETLSEEGALQSSLQFRFLEWLPSAPGTGLTSRAVFFAPALFSLSGKILCWLSPGLNPDSWVCHGSL